jgi:hypothetical protein
MHPVLVRRNSYAVWWTEGKGPRHVGKFEVARLHALLSGTRSKRLAVPLDDITDVEYRRGEIRIDRRGATSLRIGSLDAPGALLELAQSLGSCCCGIPRFQGAFALRACSPDPKWNGGA